MPAAQVHSETFLPTTLRARFVTGAAAGNITVSGIKAYDKLKAVLRLPETIEAKTAAVVCNVEDLAADADIAERAFFRVPTALNGYVVIGAHLISRGSAVGIDGSNTSVITIGKLTVGAIASWEFDGSPAFPAANGVQAATTLGSGAVMTLASAEILTVTVTNGTAANPPAFDIVLDLQLAGSALSPTDLTSEFTITATNTINNTGGTSTLNRSLLVLWDSVPTQQGG